MTICKKPVRHQQPNADIRTPLGLPGLQRGTDLLRRGSARQGRASGGATGQPVVDITLSADPQSLIDKLLRSVDCQALRQFLASVLAESDVAQALTRLRHHGKPLPITSLRRAAEMARCWSAFGAQERETLFVATLVRGVQELLADQVVGNSCTPSELMFAIVRSALHRLDDAAPRQASLLRLALGWGNEDEIDAFYVPRIQDTVLRALSSVGLIAGPTALH